MASESPELPLDYKEREVDQKEEIPSTQEPPKKNTRATKAPPKKPGATSRRVSKKAAAKRAKNSAAKQQTEETPPEETPPTAQAQQPETPKPEKTEATTQDEPSPDTRAPKAPKAPTKKNAAKHTTSPKNAAESTQPSPQDEPAAASNPPPTPSPLPNQQPPEEADKPSKHEPREEDQITVVQDDPSAVRTSRGRSEQSERTSGQGTRNRKKKKKKKRSADDFESGRQPQADSDQPPVEVQGVLELTPKGFGFLRQAEHFFGQSKSDPFVSPQVVRQFRLRSGMHVTGLARQGGRGLQLRDVLLINGRAREEWDALPRFEELTACNPDKLVALETSPDRFTTRVLDIIAPIGRGQRGLIVSPPRSGKTTMLLHMAEAIQERHAENLHLMILLVDERPEEVTEFRRQMPDAEIYASSNDSSPINHCRTAELCIERAKRMVESGEHVFLLMDSITRLARAYNNSMSQNRGSSKGRGYQSGGIVAGALEMPRRIFAAARNTREAGSLTIIGTSLVQTNSRADEAIFQEFKGTGNMELVLDRRIAEHFVFPAVDIFKSGTRREELILPEISLQKINLIRRGLAGHRPLEAMERLTFFLKKFRSNAQMLLEIKG